MNTVHRFISLGLLAALAACTQTPAADPKPPLSAELAVSPKAETFTAGGAAKQFSATLKNASGIAWSLSPAGVGSLSATSGSSVSYTPPVSVAAATTVTLTATAGGVSDSATLTVNPAPSLTVSPGTRTVVAGSTATGFSATLAHSSEAVSWSLSPNLGTLSASSGATVSYTPPATVASATQVTLTATAGAVSASATITVNPFVNTAGESRDLTLQNWPVGSSGTLNFTTTVSGSFTQTPVASAPINTAGQFSYSLPAATVLGTIAGTFPPSCGLTVVNPNNAQIANGVITATEGSNPPRSVQVANATPPMGLPGAGYASASLVYSNAAWSVTGDCASGGTTTTFNLNVVQGWNWFVNTTNSGTSRTFSSTTALPVGFDGYY